MSYIIADLLEALETNPLVSVEFTTKTGKIRIMECSRMLLYVPEHLQDGMFDTRLNGPDIVCVFDYNNCGWRAFRKDTVISFEIVDWYSCDEE